MNLPPTQFLDRSVQAWQHVTFRAKGENENIKGSTVQTGTRAIIRFHCGLHRAAVSCSHPTHFHIAVWNHSLVDGRLCPVSILFLTAGLLLPPCLALSPTGKSQTGAATDPHPPALSECLHLHLSLRRALTRACPP